MKKLSLILIAIVIYASNAFCQESPRDRFGGWTGLKGTKTGIFHTEKINNRWWIITPEGNVFWSTGMYCVRMGGIPDTSGKRPYREACIEKYGNEREWAKITRKRLYDWGFNTIGDWSADSIYREPGFAYAIGINLPHKAPNVIPKGSYGYFPDVFSQEYRNSVRENIEGKFKEQPYLLDDPALLGYFLADEPSWYGSKGRRGSLVDDFITLDNSQPGKQAWLEFIKGEQVTEAKRLEFLQIIAEQFSKVLYDSLREFDKYHMVLGSRPTRFYPEIVAGIGKYCDIFATSAYNLNQGYTIDPEFDKTIDDLFKYGGKPIMLGVLIAAQDTGLPHGIVKNQKDRGISYWRYIAKAASRPEVVGLHWFQYFDPPRHCYDQQAANWGLVNEKDDPYTDAVESIAKANNMVYAYALSLTDFVPEFNNKPGLAKQAAQTNNVSAKNTKTLKIANPGFELRNTGWGLQTWKGKSKSSIDFFQKHSGLSSLKIEGGPDAGWGSVGVGIQGNLEFTLIPGHQYRLSAWIKTSNVENYAFVRIKLKYTGGDDAYFETEGIYGNGDWKHIETKFSPREENTVEYLGAQLVGKGTAWFDDIKLELIE